MQLLAVPPRRDLTKLKPILAQTYNGERLTALCQSPRYGGYILTGTARTIDGGELHLVSQVIGSKLTRDERTGLPIRKPSDSLRELREPFCPDGVAVEIDGSDVHHGDLLHGSFNHPHYGEFEITGVATMPLAGVQTCLADWVIWDTRESWQRPEMRLTLLARAGEHNDAVPPVREMLSSIDESTN